MKLSLKDVAGLARIFLGVLSIFLLLFGIHWMLILCGLILGILYYAIPKKFLR